MQKELGVKWELGLQQQLLLAIILLRRMMRRVIELAKVECFILEAGQRFR